MPFVLQYGPAILAGVLLASIFLTFAFVWLRAVRHNTSPPRPIWPTLVVSATVLSLGFLERTRGAHGDAFLKDAIVGLGTFFVVFVGVGAPLLIVIGRSMPTTTEF